MLTFNSSCWWCCRCSTICPICRLLRSQVVYGALRLIVSVRLCLSRGSPSRSLLRRQVSCRCGNREHVCWRPSVLGGELSQIDSCFNDLSLQPDDCHCSVTGILDELWSQQMEKCQHHRQHTMDVSIGYSAYTGRIRTYFSSLDRSCRY